MRNRTVFAAIVVIVAVTAYLAGRASQPLIPANTFMPHAWQGASMIMYPALSYYGTTSPNPWALFTMTLIMTLLILFVTLELTFVHKQLQKEQHTKHRSAVP